MVVEFGLWLEQMPDNLGGRARQCPELMQRQERSRTQRPRKRPPPVVTVTLHYTIRLGSMPVYAPESQGKLIPH
jgi:hypothetical protein